MVKQLNSFLGSGSKANDGNEATYNSITEPAMQQYCDEIIIFGDKLSQPFVG